MRKSMTHLIDASPLLSRRRLERPLTTISTCCWQSHLRDLLSCFSDSLLPRSRLYRTRQYHRHHQRSRFYSSYSSCAAISTHSSASPSPTLMMDATETPPPSFDIPPPPLQLYGALAIFNFTDHVTLSHLEDALRKQQAEKSWQLFCTLISRHGGHTRSKDIYEGQQFAANGDSLVNMEDKEILDNEPPSLDLLIVPYHHCTDLYSLLLYAQDLSVHSNVISMRQQQLDKVAAYVEEYLGQPKHTFIDSVPRRPIPTYKRFQQSLQNKHQQSAWKYYTQILAEDPVGAPSMISRNHYLKFLSLVMRTEKRYLNDQQKQDMIQLVTTAHEGIPCQHGRVLTADGIEWIALIYSRYDNQQPKYGRRLVHDFLRDTVNRNNNKQQQSQHHHATADTIGELMWRILPYDIKTAHMILNTMHQRGLPQNESTYNNLIKAYAGHQQYDRALGVFEQMLTIGVTPTVPTLNTVLHIFADQGLTDRAVYIWDTLHALDLVPDTATYSEMIRCFGRVGQLKDCLYYYQLIVQQQSSSTESATSPNLYTYSTLIEAYGKRNDVRGVLRWFQTLLKQGLEPNQVIMSNVLKALGKHHQQTNMMEAVNRIANQCMMVGMKADTTLYTLLLTLQADAAPVSRSRSSLSPSPPPLPLPSYSKNTTPTILSSFSASISSSRSSSSTTTTAALSDTMEENAELAFVLQSQREMLAKCVEPNVYTYTALIDLCGKHGYLETAQQIFDLMQQSEQHQPTTVTYCAMLDILRYANHKEQVDLLLYDFLVQSKSNGSQGNRLRVDVRMKHQFRCLHGRQAGF